MNQSDTRFFLGMERIMHYAIIKWNQKDLKWEVVHYTPQLADFERMQKIHPPSENCIHLIDYSFVKDHKVEEIYAKIRALRAQTMGAVEDIEEDEECEE